MNEPIIYIDRRTGAQAEEKIYHEQALRFLYSNPCGRFLARLICSTPTFSKFYGWWQTLPITKHKIIPFIEEFNIDSSEFEQPIETYPSFNAFFTRKIKLNLRPFNSSLIIPADGRYLFYQNVENCPCFIIKGKKFSLTKLIGNMRLAKKYLRGSMIIARLCPMDYHRFHFPCEGVPTEARLINGPLYSVSPLALRQWIELLTENKRMITEIKSEKYGRILFIEIGATCVGSIHQTYTPYKLHRIGDEKGYFSFGGSSIILLFEPGCIQIDPQLLTNSSQFVETLCLLGQPIENKI